MNKDLSNLLKGRLQRYFIGYRFSSGLSKTYKKEMLVLFWGSRKDLLKSLYFSSEFMTFFFELGILN